MNTQLYCVGKSDKNQTIMKVDLDSKENNLPSKRINIVSIKIVKEGSVLYSNRSISSPKDADELLRPFLEDSDREMLIVVSLDVKNQPTSINVASIGSLNSSIVHPREIFKSAILSNSASIIVAHNHPSGIPEPSSEDINITKRLNEAGKILGINLIDHIIIGYKSYVSLKEKGMI